MKVQLIWGFLGNSVVKPPLVNTGDVGSMDREDSLEKEMATLSSILGLGDPMDRGA